MAFINIISSTLYITNTIVAYMYNELLYGIVSIILVLTSWWYHSNIENLNSKFIDKIAVNSFISCGCYHIYKKNVCMDNLFCYFVIFIALFMTVFLYYYGYYTQSFCFDPEFGNWYHSLMHGFSCIGHHAILNLR